MRGFLEKQQRGGADLAPANPSFLERTKPALRPVVLRVRSPDQQHQHHRELGASAHHRPRPGPAESELWELLLFSHKVMSDSCNPMGWAVALQAPLSMGFPRQEYQNGLPFPSPGKLPDSGIKPTCLALAGGFFTTEPPGLITISMGIQFKGLLAILQSILLLGLQFCCVSYTHSPSHSRPAHLTAAMMGRESSQACVRTT